LFYFIIAFRWIDIYDNSLLPYHCMPCHMHTQRFYFFKKIFNNCEGWGCEGIDRVIRRCCFPIIACPSVLNLFTWHSSGIYQKHM
jgi:hypothetical protein